MLRVQIQLTAIKEQGVMEAECYSFSSRILSAKKVLLRLRLKAN